MIRNKEAALLLSGFVAGSLAKSKSENGPLWIDSVQPIYVDGIATTRTRVVMGSGARLLIEVRPESDEERPE